MDIEPTTAIRQAEVTAAKTMIARTAETFGLEPVLAVCRPADLDGRRDEADTRNCMAVVRDREACVGIDGSLIGLGTLLL